VTEVFHGVRRSLQEKISGQYVDQPTAASFQILSMTSFMYHPTVVPSIVYILTASSTDTHKNTKQKKLGEGKVKLSLCLTK
jgi:hypothetical protein